MTVFWVVAPYYLVEVYGSIIVVMMETGSTFETSVNFYQTTRSNNLEDSHLRIRRCKNLKSHYVNKCVCVHS
jgi:hypothetical protein